MGSKTEISWCDCTFNPLSGCTKVAEGCKFCYAEVNYSVKMRGVKWGPNGNRVLASDGMWKQPLKWNRQADPLKRTRKMKDPIDIIANAAVELAYAYRPRVFCASLADVFEDWQRPILDNHGAELWVAPSEPDRFVPWRDNFLPHEQANIDAGLYRKATMGDVRARLFRLIDSTPHLDWLLLTKRPENVRRMWRGVEVASQQQADDRNERGELFRRNCWLGTSIATQSDADANIPELLKHRDLSPVPFVSAEPLIEQIDMRRGIYTMPRLCPPPDAGVVSGTTLDGIAWLIIGGESGPHARPCDVAWIRSLRDQCQSADVPVFIKQLGSKCVETMPPMRVGGATHGQGPHGMTAESIGQMKFKDPKGGDWMEWPEDLRVRQFPHVSKVDHA